MRVLICGSRTWTDVEPVHTVLAGLAARARATGTELVLIHGGAPGVDTIAGDLAIIGDIETIVEPADWQTYGRAAGPIRNQKMLDEHKPDVVYAFRAEGKSNGTDGMVCRARAAGIPTYVITGGR